MFLQPTKLPVATTSYMIPFSDDSAEVVFVGEHYQPVFLNTKKDTLQLDYTIESVLFKSGNGHLLNGWMIYSKKTPADVTLLHFHGNAGFLLSQYRALTPLLDQGFQIFIFDYSGFGFSEGKASRKNVLQDGMAALDYVKSRADVKDTRLVIYGQSLGGHLAAVIGTERQNDIDALVIEGAFSSHQDIAAEVAGVLGRIFVKEGYNASQSIQKYYKPVLIIHSEEDEIIPFKMGQKLFTKANEPKQFFAVKGCHICGPRFYSKEIAEKIAKILVESH